MTDQYPKEAYLFRFGDLIYDKEYRWTGEAAAADYFTGLDVWLICTALREHPDHGKWKQDLEPAFAERDPRMPVMLPANIEIRRGDRKVGAIANRFDYTGAGCIGQWAFCRTPFNIEAVNGLLLRHEQAGTTGETVHLERIETRPTRWRYEDGEVAVARCTEAGERLG